MLSISLVSLLALCWSACSFIPIFASCVPSSNSLGLSADHNFPCLVSFRLYFIFPPLSPSHFHLLTASLLYSLYHFFSLSVCDLQFSESIDCFAPFHLFVYLCTLLCSIVAGHSQGWNARHFLEMRQNWWTIVTMGVNRNDCNGNSYPILHIITLNEPANQSRIRSSSENRILLSHSLLLYDIKFNCWIELHHCSVSNERLWAWLQ
jgi:hypothetical protein